MQLPQAHVQEATQNVQRFLDTHRDALAGVELEGARRALDHIVQQFARHAVDQLGGTRETREATACQRAKRRDIRARFMRPIVAIARHHLKHVPELLTFRMPPTGVMGNRFIVAARGMASGADTYASVFLDRGMPPSFVARFREAIDALERDAGARSGGNGRRVGATAGLAADVKEGRLLLGVLDALVRPALAANEPLLRSWDAARHIARRGQRAAAPAIDAAPVADVAATAAVSASAPAPRAAAVAVAVAQPRIRAIPFDPRRGKERPAWILRATLRSECRERDPVGEAAAA